MFSYLLVIYRQLNIVAKRHKKSFIHIFIVLLIIIIPSALLFSYFERISFFKSIYWAITTASTVGYGDIVPKNNIGRIIAMFLMIVGVSILGIFLANLSSVVLDFKLGRLFGTMESYFVENHIVILGFSDYIKNSLEEILKEEKNNVILMADIDRTPIENKNLIFIKGDITIENDVVKTKLENAKLCIIADSNDSNTLIASIYVKHNYSHIYTISLVLKKELAKALKELGVNEVFASGAFLSMLLAKSTLIAGVSNFFSQLLDNDFKETLVEKPISASLVDKTFIDALLEVRKETNELLVGIKRNSQMIINPSDTQFILEKNDKLLLIGR